MSRKTDRKHAFMLVFQMGFFEPFDMAERIPLYFDETETTASLDRPFIEAEVKGVYENRAEIDAMIGAASEGWDVPRLSKTDLAIMRLAAYEICFATDVPQKVAINEAVELAKLYSTDEAPAFINGVLGKIVAKHAGNGGV